jgi:adenylyl- and sulfurtransferase ThiI
LPLSSSGDPLLLLSGSVASPAITWMQQGTHPD